MGKKDTYALTYTFTIAYYNIVEQLHAVIALLECDDVMSDVSLWEASGGSLLIADVVDALRKAQGAIEARRT